MERVQGQRSNTSKYYYNGFWFHKDSSYPHIRICADRHAGCTVRITVENGVVVYCPGEHEHDIRDDALRLYMTGQEMLRLADTTHNSYRDIFDTVCRRYVVIIRFRLGSFEVQPKFFFADIIVIGFQINLGKFRSTISSVS